MGPHSRRVGTRDIGRAAVDLAVTSNALDAGTGRRVPPLAGEPGPMPEGLVRPTDADYEAVVEEILAAGPSAGEVWIFAYGSLIWNPAYEFVEERIGSALG